MQNYEERQAFPMFAYVAMLTAPLAILAMCLVPGIPTGILLVTGVGTLCVSLPIANLLYMRTVVTEETLQVRFGYALTFYRKTFALSDISLEGPATYRPIRDAGGWGIRWGRYNGQSCRFLNARGSQGVVIETPASRFIIGSQEPDALALALVQAGCSQLQETQQEP